MAFRLPISEELFRVAETKYEYREVVEAADDVSRYYNCYREWFEQADDLCYSADTSPDDADRVQAALEPILSAPQIGYGTDEWFPLPAWSRLAKMYDRSIERIREALLV